MKPRWKPVYTCVEGPVGKAVVPCNYDKRLINATCVCQPTWQDSFVSYCKKNAEVMSWLDFFGDQDDVSSQTLSLAGERARRRSSITSRTLACVP